MQVTASRLMTHFLSRIRSTTPVNNLGNIQDFLQVFQGSGIDKIEDIKSAEPLSKQQINPR